MRKHCVKLILGLGLIGLLAGCTQTGRGHYTPPHAILIGHQGQYGEDGYRNYLIPSEYVREADLLDCGAGADKTVKVVNDGDIQVNCDYDTMHG